MHYLQPLSHAGSSGPTLICFPGAGGSAHMYRPLAAALDGLAQVYGVWLPGTGPWKNARNPAMLIELAGEFNALGELIRHTPVVFLGHSMGALLAYEVSRQLKNRFDVAPESLIVAGCKSPLEASVTQRHNLSDESLMDSLIAIGMPEETFMIEDLRASILSRLRKDLKYAETYKYVGDVQSLSCPIVAIAGDQDFEADLASMKRWEIFTENRFTSYSVKGDHFFLREISQQIVAILHTCLESSGSQACQKNVHEKLWS